MQLSNLKVKKIRADRCHYCKAFVPEAPSDPFVNVRAPSVAGTVTTRE